MVVLGISSATADSGIALTSSGEVLGGITLANNRGLSETLMPAIQGLMSDAGRALQELGAVAVTIGPGSFTGIRVGLAVAKALSYALSLPLVGLSTLESIAWAGGSVDEVVYPLLDAGKGQIYAGHYRWGQGQDRRLVPVAPDCLTTCQHIAANVSRPALLVGDAAAFLYESITDKAGIKLAGPVPGLSLPLPVAVARLGELKVAAGMAIVAGQAASVSPVYLRRSEAEIVLDRKLSLHV